MKPPISASAFALLMFFGMLVFLELGRLLGQRRQLKESDAERSGLTAVDAAVFALLGLLMAFAFSGAAARFNEKRALIGEEANAIETAYLRISILPDETQPQLRSLFAKYLDSRLATYRKLPDLHAAELEMETTRRIQSEIWNLAIAATHLPSAHPAAGILVPPALNNMIDISTTRTVALHLHPPSIVYALLFCAAMIASLLVGDRVAVVQRVSWMHIFGFITITVVVVYVMLDIEYPRTGFFRLSDADDFLVQLREHMK